MHLIQKIAISVS